jgi:hypothetical protein
MNRYDIPAPRRLLRVFPGALALLGIVIALAISSAPAHAQPSLVPATPATPAPETPQTIAITDHYGLWVAGVDLAGFAAAVAADKPEILLTSYLAAGPVVHLFHRNFKAAFGSFGLRAGLIFGGAMLGAIASDCRHGETLCGVEGTIYGGLIGAGTALVIDWFWLSEKTTRVPASPPALLRAGSLQANPDLQVSNTGSMMLGLRGSF